MNIDNPQNRSILVVEDDVLNQRLLCEYVKNMGYSINAVVDNFNEAINSVESNTPDLILMDILLKGSEDGIYTSHRIREKFDIPIVYVTGYVEDDVIERAKETNPNGYIMKPFKYKELKTIIQLALSNYDMSRSNKLLSHEYEKAFTNLRCGIITTDNEGNLLFMNNLAEMYTGYDLNDVKNRFISDVLNFGYRGLTNHLLNEVKRKGYVYHDEDYLILINKNGNKIKVKLKMGTQHLDDSSFITFLIWENTLDSTSGAYEIKQKRKRTSIVSSEINLMIICDNALARDGISKALNNNENIRIACMACSKIEYIECMDKKHIDIAVINDDHPDTDEIFDKINFLKNIDNKLSIVVTSESFGQEKELRLISEGIKGFIITGGESYDLAYAIQTIFNGELWFRRHILSKYINLNLSTAQRGKSSNIYLSNKEKEIFYFVSKGHNNREIAELLAISEKTVKNYINKINKKLGINIRKEIIN